MKKYRLLLIYGLAALGGVWLVVKVIFGPFHGKLSTLSREAKTAEDRLRKGTALLAKKDVIDKEYEKYASYFSLQNISDEEATAVFLKEVERIGREAGVTILDMKPQKETEKDRFSKQYLINIKAEASMKELVGFLYALHDSQLLFSIERLVLAPTKEGASVVNITMSLVGVVFL